MQYRVCYELRNSSVNPRNRIGTLTAAYGTPAPPASRDTSYSHSTSQGSGLDAHAYCIRNTRMM